MTDLLSAATPAAAPAAVPPGVGGVLARIQGIRALAAPGGVTGPGANPGPDGGFAALLAASQDQMGAAGLTADASLPDPGIGGLDPSELSSLSSIYMSPRSAEGSGAGSAGTAVVAEAAGYLGVPYRWGGTDPASGLDCSGLVQLVYSKLGVSLPRTSQDQATVGRPVASLAQAQPGDLVFYGSPAEHVGIYIGNGQMIDAPHTGTRVRVESVGQPTSIRRVLGSSPGAGYLSDGPAGSALSHLAAGPGPGGAGSPLGQVPSSLAPVFLSAAARYGLSPTLLAAVAKVESGYDPTAVSPAGAEGLMQLMPSTAAGLGVDPMDPTQAVDGAARMLSDNLNRFGSLPLALAAYNAGPGAVEEYGGVPPYQETQQYVQQVMALAGAGS